MSRIAALFHTFCEPSLRPVAKLLDAMSDLECHFFALRSYLDGWKGRSNITFAHQETHDTARHPVMLPAGRMRRAFWRHFARYPFDLVVAPSGFDALSALPLTQFFRMKLAVFMGGADVTYLFRPDAADPRARQYAARRRELLEQVDLFIVPCPSFAELLLECGCNRQRIALHPGGIEVFPLSNGELKHSIPGILVVEPTPPVGGLEIALSAYEIVRETLPAQLHILGSPQLRTRLASWLATTPHAQDVFVWTPDCAQEAWMKADIVVSCPVVSPGFFFDAHGYTILEAGAHALPVVATYHAGAADRVADGVTGWLVPERDVSTMADALAQLVSDENLRREMGRAGHAKMELEFEISRAASRLEGIFTSLLANPQ